MDPIHNHDRAIPCLPIQYYYHGQHCRPTFSFAPCYTMRVPETMAYISFNVLLFAFLAKWLLLLRTAILTINCYYLSGLYAKQCPKLSVLCAKRIAIFNTTALSLLLCIIITQSSSPAGLASG